MEEASHTTHHSYKIFTKDCDNCVHSYNRYSQTTWIMSCFTQVPRLIHKILMAPQLSNCWGHGNCRPKNRKTDKEGGGDGGGAELLQVLLTVPYINSKTTQGRRIKRETTMIKWQYSETYI